MTHPGPSSFFSGEAGALSGAMSVGSVLSEKIPTARHQAIKIALERKVVKATDISLGEDP